MGIWSSDVNNGTVSAIEVGASIPSALMDLLLVDGLNPGAAPDYQICKTIYTYHPLGAELAENPSILAQSQKRELQIQGAPERELKQAFDKEWENMRADLYIRNTHTISRVYGIASLCCIEKDKNEQPLDLNSIANVEIGFSVFDPLNTAGSLILDQNPNSPTFMKPTAISVAGKPYHVSRAVIIMNEQPIYIEWSNSAFGFVGRSVYQRILYPLKSYIQSMITDNLITEKAGLLVYKAKSPGSIIDQRILSFFGLKRSVIKGAKTGNVINIGDEEDLTSIDLTNLKDAAQFARDNILKNIATGARMPASMINKETMAEGFGEGTEDAKDKARYVDGIRMELAPLYKFMDNICMRRAWTPEFYKSLQSVYPETYGDVPYETAFYEWKNASTFTWPNLLQEPDSEKTKTDDIVLKAAIGVYEALSANIDQVNRAAVAMWLADVVNSRKLLFDSHLDLDQEAIANYEPPAPAMGGEPEPKDAMKGD